MFWLTIVTVNIMSSSKVSLLYECFLVYTIKCNIYYFRLVCVIFWVCGCNWVCDETVQTEVSWTRGTTRQLRLTLVQVEGGSDYSYRQAEDGLTNTKQCVQHCLHSHEAGQQPSD